MSEYCRDIRLIDDMILQDKLARQRRVYGPTAHQTPQVRQSGGYGLGLSTIPNLAQPARNVQSTAISRGTQAWENTQQMEHLENVNAYKTENQALKQWNAKLNAQLEQMSWRIEELEKEKQELTAQNQYLTEELKFARQKGGANVKVEQ